MPIIIDGMLNQIRLVGLASFLGLVATEPLVTPYADGACQSPIQSYSYTAKNGSVSNTPFSTGIGVSGNSSSGQYSFETYSNISFDAASSTTSLGQKVFWKMTQLDPGCRVLFMKQFQQAGKSTVPRAVVLYASSMDYCFTSEFNNDKMHMSFCCGTGDCSAFDIGLHELDPIDPQKPAQDNGPAKSVAKALGAAPKANIPPSPKLKMREANARGSISARAMADFQRDATSRSLIGRDAGNCGTNGTCYDEAWATCKSTITNPGAPPLSKPGKQSSVGSFQPCSSNDDCAITVTNTNTYSYEVSVSQTDSETSGTSSSQSSSSTDTNQMEVTTTNGHSLSVSAGLGWGPFSVSTEAGTESSTTNDNTNTHTSAEEQASSHSLSQTVANQTKTGTTNSKAEALSQAMTILPGGYAILTFVPFYSCYEVTIDCGTPFVEILSPTENRTHANIQSEVCTPTLNSDGTVHGSYDLLYTNPSNGDSV